MPEDAKTRIAMVYALNQWHTLTGYCDDGHLNISNVLAENAIRPFAVGRKPGCLRTQSKEQTPVPHAIDILK